MYREEYKAYVNRAEYRVLTGKNKISIFNRILGTKQNYLLIKKGR